MAKKRGNAFQAFGFLVVLSLPIACIHTDSFPPSRIAEIKMMELENGISMFHYDVGRFPMTAEGLQMLIENAGAWKSWHGPYVYVNSLVDPWNRPVIYECCNSDGKYTLLSFGRDGREGGSGEDADIVFGGKSRKKSKSSFKAILEQALCSAGRLLGFWKNQPIVD